MSVRTSMLVALGFLLCLIALLVLEEPQSSGYRTYLSGVVTCSVGVLAILGPVRWRLWRLAGLLRDGGWSLERRSYLGSGRSCVDLVLAVSLVTLVVLAILDTATIPLAGFRIAFIAAIGAIGFFIMKTWAWLRRRLRRWRRSRRRVRFSLWRDSSAGHRFCSMSREDRGGSRDELLVVSRRAFSRAICIPPESLVRSGERGPGRKASGGESSHGHRLARSGTRQSAFVDTDPGKGDSHGRFVR